ncbi:MAG: diguanylate cyclase with sensor [Proteobacteria bacterium]|nr:diguanylate cyclase with sensor [Pseudomonadota bacterium]
MKNQGTESELERKAKDVARERGFGLPENVDRLSPEEARRLLHKLHIHQIELEIQNDELRRTQMALDAARARYADLYDQAPVGYFTLDEAGLILQANRTAATVLGRARESLVAHPLNRFIVNEDQDIYYLHRKQLIAAGEPKTCDLRMLKADETTFWASLTSSVTQGPEGKPVCRIVLHDITQRKQLEAIAEATSRYSRSLIEASLDPLVTIDTDGLISDVNAATEKVTGCPRKELIGSDFCNYFTDPENARTAYQLVFSQGYASNYLLAIRHVSGKVTDVLYNASPYRDSDGEVVGVFAAARDITERIRATEELREQKEFFHLIAENIGDFIAVLDTQGRRLYNSPSYALFFGPDRDLRGTESFVEVHPDDRERVKKIFAETVKTGRGRQIEYRLVLADGNVRTLESRGSVIRDREGKVARVVVVAHDITERKLMEYQMRQMAFHDTLTQLPNRRLLGDRLSHAMASSARSGYYGAVMFLDLDNFKPLNDQHGHDAGDLLLIEVAERLKSCVREMDTVARFGGDEFVVMISELDMGKAESIAEAELIGEKIRHRLAEPYHLNIKCQGKPEQTIEHHCTASIGVVVFVNHEDSQENILRWADAAMYQAKENKRNSIQIFDSKLGELSGAEFGAV